MNTISFNDGMASGSRTPRLHLAKGGEVRKFQGENIPGFCAIATSTYNKNGKWSNTDYTLTLAPGVRDLYFLSPLHGTWGEDLSSWGSVAEKLQLPVNVAKELIRKEYSRTAERLDKLEEFAMTMEAEGNETESVIISFGAPTNRAIQEGYWETPKSGTTSNGEKVMVKPDPDWNTPTIVEPKSAKIVSSRLSPGMHGGYRTIEVVVPISQGVK